MDSGNLPDKDDHFYSPIITRSRLDKDGLIVETVFAYDAGIGEANNAPLTYQQAMNSDDATRIKEMERGARGSRRGRTMGTHAKKG